MAYLITMNTPIASAAIGIPNRLRTGIATTDSRFSSLSVVSFSLLFVSVSAVSFRLTVQGVVLGFAQTES